MTRADRRIALAAALVVAALALAAPARAPAGQLASPAPGDPPVERVVHVPAAQWDAVLARAEGGVLLRWEEYRALWEAANARLQRDADRLAPPSDAVLATAALTGAPDGDRLALRLAGRLYVLRDGAWTRCVLGGDGQAWGSARLDDGPALVDGAGADRSVLAVGVGWHSLVAEVGVPIRRDGIRRVATLTLPRAAATRLEVRLPPDVAVTVGGAPADVRRTATATTVVVSPQPDAAVTLAWEPRGAAGGASVAEATEDAIVAVSEGQVAFVSRLHVTLHGAPAEAVRVRVPPDVAIAQVEAPDLATWAVEGAGAARRLVLRPTAPRSGEWTVTVAGDAALPPQGRITLPHLAVVDAVLHDTRLVLLTTPEVDVRPLPDDAIREQPLPADISTAALPVADDRLVPRRAWAWSGADRALSADIAPVAQDVAVDVATAVAVGEESVVVTAVLAVQPRRGTVHELAVVLPDGFRPIAVRDGATRRRLAWEASGAEPVLTVRLAHGVGPERRALVEVRAEGVPADWLDESWDERTLPLPIVGARRVQRVRGHVGVSSDAAFDLSDADLVGLTRKDVQALEGLGIRGPAMRLGYRFEGSDARATLRVRRVPTRVSTATTVVARVEPSLLAVHAEVRYVVEGTGVREVRLRLPAEGGRKARFECPDGPVLQQRIPPPEAGAPEAGGGAAAEGVVWQLVFQGRARGVFHVTVAFDRPLAPGVDQVLAPRVVPLHEGRAETTFVVEAGPDVEVKATPDGLAELDLGEIPPLVAYHPAHRLVSAWRLVRDDGRLPLALATHQEQAVLPTFVTEARAATVVGRGGGVRTTVEYRLLNTRAQYLRVALPEAAALWSLHVADEPQKPLRVGDDVWVPLAAGPDAARGGLLVRLVYEVPDAALGALARREVLLPRLPDTPVGQTTWTVHVPDDYRVLGVSGTLEGPSPAHERPFLLAAVGGLETVADGLFSLRCGTLLRMADESKQAAAPMAPAASTAAPPPESMDPGAKADEVMEEEPAEDSDDAEPEKMIALEEVAEKEEKREEEIAEAQKAAAEKPRVAQRFAEEKPPVEPDKPTGFAGKDGGAVRAAGLLSLDVTIPTEGQAWTFERLGGEGELTFTLARTGALGSMRLALSILAFLLGLALVRRWRPWRLLVGTLVGATAAALLVPSVTMLANALAAGLSLAAVGVAAWRLGVRLSGNPRARRVGLVVAAAAVVLLVLTLPFVAMAAPGAPMDGVTVYAPYEGDPPSRTPPARVFLPQDLFDRLWRAAHPEATPLATPVDALVSEARYDATLAGRQLRIRARLTVAAPGDGWTALPLPLGGAAVETAVLDGAPVALQDRGGTPTLLLHGPAAPRTLTLEFSVPIDGEPRRGSARLGLPAAAAARIVLSLPDADLDPSVEADAPVAATTTVERGAATLVADVGGASALTLHWAPASLRATGGTATLVVQSVVRARLARGGARVDQSIQVTVRDGVTSGLALALPPGQRVLDVRGADVATWRIEDGGQRLAVTLRAARSRPFALQLTAVVPQTDAAAAFPIGGARVEGAQRQTDVLVVEAEPPLLARPGEGSGLTRATSDEVAWPAGEDAPAPGALVYVAPRPGWSLPVAAVEAPARLEAEIHTSVVLNRAELYGLVRVELQPEGRAPLAVALDLPAPVALTSVSAPALTDWRRLPAEDGRTRVELAFGRPVRSGDVVELLLEGRPDGAAAVPIPGVHVIGAERERAALAVAVEPGLTVRVDTAHGLESVAPASLGDWAMELTDRVPQLGFRAVDATWTLAVALEDTPLQLAVAARSDATVEDQTLRVVERFDYEVLQGVAHGVQLTLPAVVAGRARLVGDVVRDRDVVRRDDGSEEWTVRLHGAQEAPFSLAVYYEIPLERGERAALPRIAPTGVDRVRREVIVRNASRGEVDVAAAQGLAPLPLDDAGEGEDGAGRAVARYQAEQDGWTLGVGVRELATEAILEASVDFAEVTTVVGADGVARSRAVFQVQNRSEQYLRLRLPEEVAVWGTTVAGDGVRPSRGADDDGPLLMVPLVRTGAGDLAFEVVVVYAQELGGPLGWTASIEPAAARVVGVPVARTVWHVWLPEGYEASSTDGNVEEVLDVASYRLKLASQQEELRRLDRTIAQGNERDRTLALRNLETLSVEYNRAVDELATLQEEVIAPDNPVYRRYAEGKVQQEADALLELLNTNEASGYGNFTIVDGRLQVNPQQRAVLGIGAGLGSDVGASLGGPGGGGGEIGLPDMQRQANQMALSNEPPQAQQRIEPEVNLDLSQRSYNTLVRKGRWAASGEDAEQRAVDGPPLTPVAGDDRTRGLRARLSTRSGDLDDLVDAEEGGEGDGDRGGADIGRDLGAVAGPSSAVAAGGAGGLGLFGVVAAPGGPTLPAAPLAGVHSLDIVLPTAGTDHHFSKLDGGAELSIRLVRSDVGERLGAWGAALGLFLVTFAGLRLARRERVRRAFRRGWPAVLLAAGIGLAFTRLGSLAALCLVVGFVAGLAALVRLVTRRSAAA